MSQRIRLFVGHMTGAIYATAHYTFEKTEGEEILRAKTKHDVTPDFAHALRLMAAGAVDPPQGEFGERYCVVDQGDLRMFAALTETMASEKHLGEQMPAPLRAALARAKKVLHAETYADASAERTDSG
jgi:hypothetical protein